MVPSLRHPQDRLQMPREADDRLLAEHLAGPGAHQNPGTVLQWNA